MDAHALTHPEPAEAQIVRPQAFLPGEDADRQTDEEPGRQEAPAGRAAPPRNRHQKLLAGGSVAVILLVSAGIFIVSPYNHVIIVPAGNGGARNSAASSADRSPGSVLAPAAKLARAPLPTSAPSPIKSLAAVPPNDAQLEELLAYKGSDGASKTYQPPAHAARPVSPAGEIGMTAPAPASATPDRPAEKAADALSPTQASMAVATLNAPSSSPPRETPHSVPVADSQDHDHTVEAFPAPRPSSIPAPTPDPIEIATHMKPAEMSTRQEIQVLALVTELGALIRDEKTEIAGLRVDQGKTGAKLDDFDRRLSLAEAKGAINAAMGAATGAIEARGASAIDPHPVAAGQLGRGIPASVSAAAPAGASPAGSPASTGPKHYRVQAASPNLAMLAALDRSGDESAQLEVAIGDDVPGYGKVTSIRQHGTNWVVQTNHGAIP